MTRKVVSLIVVLTFALAHPSAFSNAQTSDADSIISLLRLVPATQSAQRTTTLLDLTRAEAALASLGLFRPDEGASTDEVIAFLAQARERLGLAVGPYVSGYGAQAVAIMDDLRANAGYDARNVLQAVQAGAPPEVFSAVTLDKPTDDVLDALLDADSLPEPTLEETYLGVPLLGWGQALSVNFPQGLKAPAFDELGRGSRLGFMDQTLLYSLTDDGIRFMVETSQGRILALADLVEINAIVTSLEGFQVYSAVITNQTPGPLVQRDVAPSASTANILRLRRYDVLAGGIGWGNGFYAVFALYHPNAESANANAVTLHDKLNNEASVRTNRPWREVFNLDQAEVNVRGALLEAKLPLRSDADVGAWLEILETQDSLFWHND